VQERDSFSLGANARFFINELDACRATPLEHRVEVVDRKADVVDSRTPFRQVAPDRRRGVVGLQQLHQWLTGAKADYPRAVRIVELHFLETQHIPKERERLRERLYRDPNMRNTGATRGCWGH